MIWMCPCGWYAVTSPNDKPPTREAAEHKLTCPAETCGCGEPAHSPVPPIREVRTGETLP